MERPVRTRHGVPCPICGEENQKCSYTSKLAFCVNVPSERECGGKVFIRTWIHVLKKEEIPKYLPRERVVESHVAPREYLDKVYRAFLKMMTLKTDHWKMLIKKNVPAKMVLRNMYRSVPEFKERWRYANKLIELGLLLENIPGFFQATSGNRSWWTFYAKEGMFIPVQDKDGYIVRLRIRLDHPELKPNGEEKGKYRWFSSTSLKCGTASGSVCHIARGNDEEVWITEGEKKGDVGNFLTGWTFIGLPGVGEWIKAIEQIQKIHPKRVVVAYDADKATNPNVAEFESQLIEVLKRMKGIEILIAYWDENQGKGIDDLLCLGGGYQLEVA